MSYGKITADRQWGAAVLAGFAGLLALAATIGLIVTDVVDAPALVAIAMGLFFSQVFTVVRCLKRRSANQLSLDDLDQDSRPPVLYLRPFTQDNAVLSSGPRIFNLLNPFSWGKVTRWRGLLPSWAAFWTFKWTFEQLLAAKTQQHGPLVAIGQPGAPPIMGAHNLFVGEDWQARVADLSQRAQLVVLAAGDTPGILWEVQFMLEKLDPTKCLIYVENGRYRLWWPMWRKGSRRALWKKFRALSAQAFPVPLPEKIGGNAFIGFDAGWVPRPLDRPVKPEEAPLRETVAHQLTQIVC